MTSTTLAFAIGFVLGIVSTILLQRTLPLLKQIRENAKVKSEEAQVRRTSGLEDNHRRLTLRRAQGMHLAAQLFALNELLEEPKLLAPPMQVEPGATNIQEDVISQTLPYMPDWPELAAIYRAPTLNLIEAVTGETNIVIVGAAGTGKTVALAHLASLAANLQIQLGPRDAVPFHYHIADLQLPFDPTKDVLTPVISAASERAPMFDLRKLPDFIKLSFNTGAALLLIDGFDEVDTQTQTDVAAWFKAVMDTYPGTRIVTTGTPNQLNGLISLGFSPLALMSWKPRTSSDFIQKWGEAWTRSVSQTNPSSTNEVDPILLNEWLAIDNTGLTPLELTLKVWAAYAGDGLGSRVLDFIATHLRRVAPSGTPVAALELLAMQVVLTSQPIFDPSKARGWVKQYDIVEDKSIESAETVSTTDTGSPLPLTESQKIRIKKSKASSAVPSYGLLSKMVDSGLLVMHPNEKMRFLHPVFNGYLAGQAVGDNDADTSLLAQADWDGKILALKYLAARADASVVADILLKESSVPLHSGTFTVARWLRDAPKDAKWRAKVFASLLSIMQAEGQPVTLRAKAMAAFVASGDPGATTLFRQLLNSRSFEVIPLAALGCGALRDRKAVPILEQVLQAPGSVQRAACFALVAIGMDQSLEAVARALLNGDEELRRAAAQALANDPKEGHETLREAASLTDIMVRRAAVHGLARVEQPWALEKLQVMQVEDDQWAVRNLANQYVEEITKRDPRVPKKLTPPSETPWVIEFASKQGVGIPRGGPATEVLVAAFKHGSVEQRLAAINYLKRNANEGIVGALYNGVYGEDPEISEASFLAVQEIAANGMNIPHPNQFGLG
ncbi:MAG: HEAT repeat domain-containing protein [Anaerolineales bacterium]|nr:HEAT repeat domain-containing protein [Anaerolineales bacterium]